MIPSLPKLLGLIAIIWVVWTLFRIYETRQAAIRANQTKDDEAAGRRDQSDPNHSVELRECKQCGSWVSGKNCGRENCPY